MEEEEEARGVVARVVEPGWRTGWPGRPPKRRRRTDSGRAGSVRGLCASDPIDVVDGVVCVGNGIASRANLEMETNVWKDAVRFREGLANGVGISGEVRAIFRGSINLNLAAEEEEVEVQGGVTCNGDFGEISEGLGVNGLDLNSLLDLNEGLDMEDECGERFDFQGPLAKRSRIDLNLEATIDLDENVGINGHESVIDLNSGPNCEAEHRGDRGKIQESVLAPVAISNCGEGNVSCEGEKFVEVDGQFGKLEEVQSEGKKLCGVRVFVCSSVDVCQDKDSGSIVALGSDVMGNVPLRAVKVDEDFDSSVQQDDKSNFPGEPSKTTPGNFESPYTLGSVCRKRRTYFDKANTSETVLRRSARRGSLKCYDSNPATARASCYVASSPAVSALSEEQPEDPILLPPKFPLPPSSQTFNLEGLPVMDIFSVHAFLRSFSLFLFLSPFELEDFVFSLKLESPNSLVDNIHVSLLMTLRMHLEHLSKEGTLSALTCLRSLNWDLLDHQTWPMFLSQYFLLHGSSSFKLHSVNLLKVGYYKQPVTLKIEILRSLCDEVIETEAVRSELVRRCSVGDPDFDFVRKAKTNRKKKRTRLTEPLDRAEEAIGDHCDWNTDECCLCKMEGILICCDSCPAAYHARCVGIATDLLPEGEWYCPECAIDRDHPGLKPGRSLRGAELLGIDVHGRLYFSYLSYLLVSDSSDAEFRYYHGDDLNRIFVAFKCSESFFTEISRAIHSKWGAYFSTGGANVTYMENNRHIATPLDQSTMSYSAASEVVNKTRDLNHSKQESVFKGSACPDSKALNSQKRLVTEMGGLRASPEGSFDTTLTSSDMQKNELGYFDESKLKEDTSVEQKTFYVNFYYFGRIAASVAEKLIGESNKLKEDPDGSEEETILAQMKVISTKCSKFYWPDYMNMDVQKESCGWCFSCRTSTDLDCLFKMHMDSVPNCDTDYMVGSLFSKMNKKDHLMDVLCCILFFEERLHGLLCGPWLNSSYRNTWRQNVLKVADLASAKFALLELETNLRSIVFSEEWFKYEDSSAKRGSAFHVINSSGASSKLGSGRKKVRCSDAVSHCSSSGPVMFWWRGRTLSRQLYSWKVIPRSLISRTARKAGSTKIHGISYPESSELPRRSKSVAWRAAVESSMRTELLALQVRELHLNIKWDDIEHALFLRKYDKELMKSERAFRKAILRRKCVDGGAVKYLVDFGKRKFLPDIVTKQGALHEEGSKERKKYWLNEIFVPMHLLKGFEEKRIARKNQTSFLGCGSKTSKRLDLRKNNSARLSGDGVVMMKNSRREKCFSYLFMKAERAEQYLCGHCKKTVSIKDAVSCCCCQGFFHKRHVRNSGEGITAECTYTCHKCPIGRSGKIIEGAGGGLKPKGSIKKKSAKANSKNVKSSVKPEVSTRKSERIVKKLRILKLRRGRRISGKKKTARKLIVKAAANGKNVSPGLPLRRSARPAAKNSSLKVKFQAKKKRKQTRSKRKNLKGSKTGLSWKRKRTEACYSYWANGLRLSGSQTDERVVQFKEKNMISSGDSTVEALKCHLCGEGAYQSVTNFISCENCGGWYHGDAFGLDDEKLRQLIGFRCNKCRGKIPPPCPSLVALTSNTPDR